MFNKKILLWFGIGIIVFIGIQNFIFADGTWTDLTGTNLTWVNQTGTISSDWKIVIDPITKKIYIQTWSSNNEILNTWIIEDTHPLVTIPGSWEFIEALNWMYNNWLTKYDNEAEYRPNDGLTREEAAKIIWQAYNILWYQQIIKNQSCDFTDWNQFDPSLSWFITDSCKWGLFKWANGNFMPRQTLTRPQAMAVLVRMFEGKLSYENRVPRWWDYYLKWQALGLTTLNDQNAFDMNISRKEIAIYIYRLKNIVTNESLKTLWLNKLSLIWTTTWTVWLDSDIVSNFSSIANSVSVTSDPELQEAICRMNDNGLTSYKTIQDYKPFEILLREQAAKILVTFANVFSLAPVSTWTLPTECIFKDISDADASLMTYIENACKANILKWSNGNFNPKISINKAQFITAMIRLFEWNKLDETTNPRWTNYFQKAQEMWIVSPADAITFENPITRYEVALFLYRFKVKYQMLQNINSNKVQNEIITTVPGSVLSGLNVLQANVYMDVNLLQNWNFDVGYVEILWTRYKIVRSSTEKYFSNNFVRYGDLFDLENDEKAWTASFIVSNNYLIEWTVRISWSNYLIQQLPETSAYYKIKKI